MTEPNVRNTSLATTSYAGARDLIRRDVVDARRIARAYGGGCAR